MKLYLPHSFTMLAKDGTPVEFAAGTEADFAPAVAEALKARFGAVEPANADRAEKVEPAAKVVASPSAKTAG